MVRIAVIPGDGIGNAVVVAVKQRNTMPDVGGTLTTPRVGDFVCSELRRRAS